jgi:organic hydroperoxide reductase OsmC/OhrA
MAEYTTTVAWSRGGALFTDNRYSRGHKWTFDGGLSVPASASPLEVMVPLADPFAIDPEEAFVAALSSCHMLGFLSIAAKRGFTVDTYEDNAVGHMEKDPYDRVAITRVVLRPSIHFSGESVPSHRQVDEMHDEAHRECFIANSVRTVVSVKSTTV